MRRPGHFGPAKGLDLGLDLEIGIDLLAGSRLRLVQDAGATQKRKLGNLHRGKLAISTVKTGLKP